MRDNNFSFELCLDCGKQWLENDKEMPSGHNKDLTYKEVMECMRLQRVIPIESFSKTVRRYVNFHIEGWANRDEGLIINEYKTDFGTHRSTIQRTARSTGLLKQAPTMG